MLPESAVMKTENDDNSLAFLDDLDGLIEAVEHVSPKDELEDFSAVSGDVIEELHEVEEERTAEDNDDVLADFDLPEAEVLSAEPVAEVVVGMSEDLIAQFDMAITKQELYDSSESSFITTEAPDLTAKKSRRTTSAKSRTPATPRSNRDMSAIPAHHFVLTGDISTMTDAQMESDKDRFIKGMPEIVKVQEKIITVMASLNSGAKLSPYIAIPVRQLLDNGTITSADIIAAYMATGSMGTGTARSQCTQMMTLLPYLGLAARSDKSLALNNASLLATSLQPLL